MHVNKSFFKPAAVSCQRWWRREQN